MKTLKPPKPFLKEHALIGIDKIEPLEEQVLKHDASRNHTIKAISPGLYHLPATHTLYLMQPSWSGNFSSLHKTHVNIGTGNRLIRKTTTEGVDFNNPDQNVGLMIWSRRALLGRNPGGTFFYYEDKLYHSLTWTDILGSNHRKESAPRWSKNKRLYLYVQQRTDEECEKMTELFQKEQPPVRTRS
jgi:hypothetical protein